MPERKAHARLNRGIGQALRKSRATRRFVLRQMQGTRQRRVGRQGWLHLSAGRGIEQSVRHTGILQHRDGGCSHRKIALAAHQLQIALAHAILDAKTGPKRMQLIAAVKSQALHPRLVDPIAFQRALPEPGRQPACQCRTGHRPKQHRRLGREQIGQHLPRHAGRRPGRDIGRRHDAGIAPAGLARDRLPPLEHRDLESVLVEIPGGAGADDAATDHRNMPCHRLRFPCPSADRATR